MPVLRVLLKMYVILNLFIFYVLDLECKVMRKFYIELASVIYSPNIGQRFVTEHMINHRDLDKVSDAFAHKDKSTILLNMVYAKMKKGDAGIFKKMLDTLHFYGNDSVRAVVSKMKRKLMEMRVNKRNDIEQRRNDKIAGIMIWTTSSNIHNYSFLFRKDRASVHTR